MGAEGLDSRHRRQRRREPRPSAPDVALLLDGTGDVNGTDPAALSASELSDVVVNRGAVMTVDHSARVAAAAAAGR